MTKLVRKVARQDALRELRDKLLSLAGRISWETKDFITNERRSRVHRNHFGKKSYWDKYTDRDGNNLLSKLEQYDELERLYNRILMSSDEFVFLGE